ncbi:quinoprotein glucose dehydrogenase [Litorivivens lipolytica]|uniref:Quinoprotein glucose dehydrogenase n=1 Tax=Litorivivens lipolytica TaxID=1524264 RepID=A0A7W4Z6J3_9GAMM|nr:pyrroloquinoline quinone-dependent dehydrogenase [Litorivivens lipolytica]MBB3048574.1 quinoprotein glucose dehydrogenase [Litorivivens lipolytica]
MQKNVAICALTLALAGCSKPTINFSGPIADWPAVGQNNSGQRYSALNQIDRDNVAQLKPAWTYHLKDYSSGGESHGATALQLTPLVVNGAMYVCTPYNRVISLDPENGTENWVHDPQVDLTGVYTPACRGVSYWQGDGAEQCDRRIYVGTLDARLIALDADTGKPCTNFGEQGAVDLTTGLGKVNTAEYYLTSPPLVLGDKVITGAFVQDGQRVDAPSGAIRAFDAVSGELLWAWDPVPPTRTPVTADDIKAGKTLTPGTPNAWGLLSGDEARNLVFVPTGNPSPDHYAGTARSDLDYYGSSVVALNADTGKVVWNFQTVHHDIWDYDLAAQPVSFSFRGEIPAVIAATKMGHVFFLHRETGKPLLPIEERPVPQTDIPGEFTAPTQPFPIKPEPLHPATLTEDEIWGITPADKKYCRELFNSLRYEGIFTPPSFEGTLAYPGLGGGINWGSVSVDPVKQRMVVNLQVAPFTMKVVPQDEVTDVSGSDLVGLAPQRGTPYAVTRGVFATEYPDMKPCVEPPWGKLVSIDLNTGDILWQRELGNLNKLAPLGLGKFFPWGTPNTGGSIQTAGGLIFIGATLDHYFRAFDSDTGELLWEQELPYAAHATSMTYRLHKDSKQYVVIAAGGHGPLGSAPGDALIAFALED